MAIYFEFIPPKKDWVIDDSFIGSAKMTSLFLSAEFKTIAEGSYDVLDKINNDVGLSMDFISDYPYQWAEDFDPENESPKGNVISIRTNGDSVPFVKEYIALLYQPNDI